MNNEDLLDLIWNIPCPEDHAKGKSSAHYRIVKDDQQGSADAERSGVSSDSTVLY